MREKALQSKKIFLKQGKTGEADTQEECGVSSAEGQMVVKFVYLHKNKRKNC